MCRLLKYCTNFLRSLRPPSPPLPGVDTSFIKQRKRGRKGGVKVKFGRRPFRPYLPCVLAGNVRSLKNKTDELCSLCKHDINYRQASVITLTETWLTNQDPSSCFEIDNYSLFRGDRNSNKKQKGGGVCTYINNRWCHPNNINVRRTYSDDNIEFQTINIRPFYLPREFTNVVIINVYIPPSADGKTAKTILRQELHDNQVKSPDSVIILTGDFNHCRDFQNTGFQQYVNCCTREDKTLDLVFCNVKDGYTCSPRAPLGRSDHCMLLLLPKYRPVLKRIKPVKKCVPIWNVDVCDELRGCFECTDWNVFIDSCDSVDELNDCVTEYVKFCEEAVCKSKEIIMFPNNKPWISKYLKRLLNEKKTLFAKGEKEDLKTKQIEIKREIQKSKNYYKEKIEQCFRSGNIKDTWKGLKTAINYKPKPPAVPDDIVVESLNKFYARFDTTDIVNIIEIEKERLESTLSDELAVEVKEDETKITFSKINEKKAPGPDGVKGRVLKGCAEQLSFIFTHIFNMSLQCTSIPNIWKTSKIIPIPKKDKVESMNDLRPVALTSIVMKSLERLILCKIRKQFMQLIDDHQFAYQPRRSVEDAILLFTNNIYRHLDQPKSYCRLLFADFSSAFNTMQPQLLINKMSSLNIDNHIVAWVLEFLTERVQYVQVGDDVSSNITTNTGAPQGCVLSPVLFTIYTNDCRSQNPSVPLIKFADDTTLQGLITNGNEEAYRTEVDRFVSWCDDHHLELNISKTKELVIDFRRNKEPVKALSLKNTLIDQVPQYKYLGVTIDDKLQWSEHVNKIKSKVCKRMYFLTQLAKFKIDKTLCTLFYRSVIESVFLFCIAAWGGNCSATDKDYINRSIKKAARFTNYIEKFDTMLNESCLRKIHFILEDEKHPLNPLIQKSDRSGRLISMRTKSERHRRSFLPLSVRQYNHHN